MRLRQMLVGFTPVLFLIGCVQVIGALVAGYDATSSFGLPYSTHAGIAFLLSFLMLPVVQVVLVDVGLARDFTTAKRTTLVMIVLASWAFSFVGCSGAQDAHRRYGTIPEGYVP